MSSVPDTIAALIPGRSYPFHYLDTDHAPLYRAIMRLFVEANARFVSQLRQEEILRGLRTSGFTPQLEQTELESALARLCQWGNLEAETQAGSVTSVEDFYDRQKTFRLTAPGAAAQRALEAYDRSSAREHVLQYNGLTDIRVVLEEIKQLLQQSKPDTGRLYRSLLVLRALFEELERTAQMFLGELARAELHSDDARSLSEYGQRLMDELVLQGGAIGERIADIDALGVDTLLQVIVERSWGDSRGLRDQWRSYWGSIRSWFVSEAAVPSKSDRLRERVRTALPVLLAMVVTASDRRNNPIDRVTDFQVLARWFAHAGSDAEAHLLWRTAFGLCPARHLMIDEATLEDREAREIPVNASWFDAPPLRFPVVPQSVVSARTGGLSRMVDRSGEKQKLADAARTEAQRLLRAQHRFGTGNRIRLSEMVHLDAGELELFLDILGEAVSARVHPADPVEILSVDGSFKVKLEATNDGHDAMILTTEGMFSGPDHWISIEQTTA